MNGRLAGQRPAGYRGRIARRVAGAALCLLLVALGGALAVHTVWGQALDALLMDALARAGARFTRAQAGVMRVVSVPALIVGGLAIGAVGVLRRRPTLGARALAVVAGANLTAQALKAALDRPDLGITLALPNSLPSGHAAFAASLSIGAVIVASPAWRTPVATLGWAWITVMGASAIAATAHRPADVVAAILVCGAWGLALAPAELAPPSVRGRATARVLGRAAWALAALGAAIVVVALWGVSVPGLVSPGLAYLGFQSYLAAHPVREAALAIASVLLVAGSAGAVLHEVDRLCWTGAR